MGRCNFGCMTLENGKILPVIEVSVDDKAFEFVCQNVAFDNMAEARSFAMLVYLALTGEQQGLQYNKEGDIKSMVQQ